ncbi:MAG: secondary thiamine-phosphate synthase enzyme YjbQ [Planctomycetes bacterium]|nr:secondary thiamine-phosphate synthase enzyme YjbQ [Planctomycetota bacterium]
MDILDVKTTQHSEFQEITKSVQAVVARSGAKRGHVIVYVPHTTAGVTINENADPDVRADMQADLERLVPWKQGYYRHGEGNSAAHTKAALMGHSVLLPIEQGKLVLGTWQGVYFCEFDGPRSRKVYVQISKE